MAQKLIDDVAQLSPHTEVRPHTIEINDPWDFEEVYAAFLDFANRYRFDTENEEYLVHITTGTHVAQICWFLLTEARYLPASLLQTSPAPKGAADDAVAAGIYSVIDLDLSRYAALTSRFQREQQQSVSFLKAGIETRNATFNALIDRIE
ncbi:transcriptional regulator, partial [Klebsiella michiganensis]